MSGKDAREAQDAGRRADAGHPPATGPDGGTPDGPADGETCDHCGSVFLEWRKCKLICRNCAQINKSCADL